jgi:hypothetical protein
VQIRVKKLNMNRRSCNLMLIDETAICKYHNR